MPEQDNCSSLHYYCLVSASAGKAIIMGPDQKPLYVMDVEQDYLSAVTGINLPMLIQSGLNDWLPCYDLTLQEIRQRLDDDAAFTLVFSLVMMMLEPNDPEGREHAAAEIAESLTCTNALALLRNVLYANTMPAEADLNGAIESSHNHGIVVLSELLQEVRDNQRTIITTCKAWQMLPDNYFGSDRQLIRVLAGRAGLFRIVALNEPRETVQEALKSKELSHFPGLFAITAAWMAKIEEIVS